MIRLPFRRHARLKRQADAYLDGELAPAPAAQFEAHIASCASCNAVVARGRALKGMLTAVPQPAPARSFRITPAMLVEEPSIPISRGRPLPALRFAQAAAVVAVIGLATVAIVDASDGGSDGSGHTTLSSADRNTSESTKSAPVAAQDSAGGAAATAADPTAVPKLTAPTPVPPSTGIGAQGAAASPSPAAAVDSRSAGASPPAAPATADDNYALTESSSPAAGAPAAPAPRASNDDDSPGGLRIAEFALGAAALAALAAWFVIRRRQQLP